MFFSAMLMWAVASFAANVAFLVADDSLRSMEIRHEIRHRLSAVSDEGPSEATVTALGYGIYHTFFTFPQAQRKTLTTNTIERLHEDFRRRIKLRKIDGWRKIAAVLSQHAVTAA